MSMLKPYEAVVSHWKKEWGHRPTISQLKAIHDSGMARDGSKTAFALAMMMRNEGASQVQIKHALGATYRNRANQLCLLGLAQMKRNRVNGQVVYKLEVKTRDLKKVVTEYEQRMSV